MDLLFYGIRVRKLTLSREAFVKAWLTPAETSVLEPGEEVPERVTCRGNVRRLTPACPPFGPDHVGPKPLPHSPARCVGRCDQGGRERKPPRCCLALEAAAATAVTDEVPDLVQRDEVAHLPTDGGDSDLEASLAAAVTMPNGDHDGASASVDPADSVRGTEVVDVAVEGLGLHRASVVGPREVTVMRTVSCGRHPCLVGSCP